MAMPERTLAPQMDNVTHRGDKLPVPEKELVRFPIPGGMTLIGEEKRYAVGKEELGDGSSARVLEGYDGLLKRYVSMEIHTPLPQDGISQTTFSQEQRKAIYREANAMNIRAETLNAVPFHNALEYTTNEGCEAIALMTQIMYEQQRLSNLIQKRGGVPIGAIYSLAHQMGDTIDRTEVLEKGTETPLNNSAIISENIFIRGPYTDGGKYAWNVYLNHPGNSEVKSGKDSRSGVYALGKTIFEAVTARKFENTVARDGLTYFQMQHLDTSLKEKGMGEREKVTEFIQALHKALGNDENERFDSGAELAKALFP